MLIMMTMMIMIMMISAITMFLAMLIGKKLMLEREKMSPFECGFDPKSSARLPFSLQFFIIATIFLIFDVEITLLVPFIILMKFNKIITMTILMMTFIIILIMGLYHEWNQETLNWTL